tara:strand:+ start:447 stop:575 length:129 start_codon:yes stop_codon:yes gene_type:complete
MAPISEIVPSESRKSGDPEFIHGDEFCKLKSQVVSLINNGSS